MLHSLSTFLPLAASDLVRSITFAPAVPWWIIIPGVAAVAIMIVYLYSVQRQIASARIIAWLTGIRISLILLLGLLLLRPLWVWRNTHNEGETLWVVLDQSMSMAQTDKQSTRQERLRWADALGLLPPESRPAKLDRDVVQLTTLHDELLNLQHKRPAGADEAESAKLTGEFVQSLKVWNENLNDVAARLEKEPKAQTGDAASIPAGLRSAANTMAAGLLLAAQRTRPDDAAVDVPWAKVGEAIDSVLAKLVPLSDQTDAEFLTNHGGDAQVKDALAKTAAMRRADIAYAALVGKSRDLPRSLIDVFERQNTKVLTFAGGQQIIAMASKSELPKALRAGVEPVGSATDVTEALKFVSEQISQGERASVLVVSDGRINEGGDPTDAAQRLASRGVHVFTLGLGSRKVAPDAAVDFVDAPEWIYKDDTLKASALVRFDGLAGQSVKVEFLRGSTSIDSQTITPTSNQSTEVVTFRDKPPEADVYEYSVRVQEMPNEVVKENNVQNFRVTVKDDKLHVLVIDEQPRFEYRYLVNYLKRDKRVQLQQVLLQAAHVINVKNPTDVKASPTNTADTAQVLPATAEEWSAFDLIVLGDIPTESLPPEMQKNIATAVRDRGTTLLVIAGQLNMPARYTGSPLAELLPVHLSSNWSVSTLNEHLQKGFRPAIAPEGINTVLNQLDMDESTNARYWNAMGTGDPKGYWHSEQTQAKQSASVLWQIKDLHDAPTAQGDDTLAAARQRALLATMPVGVGRVMYAASDSMWRLRQVDGANLTDRFWGQVMRWVAQSDMPAGGRFVRFGTSKPRYLSGEPIVVSVRLLKPDFTPMTGQAFKVIARGVTPKDPTTGQVQGGPVLATADAVETPESPGVYRATISGIKPGGVQISLLGQPIEKMLADDVSATQKTLLIDVLSGTDREMRNVNADHNMLARIAQAGNGIAVDAAYADVLAQHVPNLQHPRESVQQIGLFADPENPLTRKAHWGFLILFVTLISAEWILRKVGGLV